MDLDHILMVNVHNFEVRAGKAAVDVFKESFDKKRMNTAGAKSWPHWIGKYKGKSLMEETGSLKKSIKVKSNSNHKIVIFTDPRAFTGAARHKGFCYAGVHNNLNSLTNRPLRGPKAERQFMGDSTVLEKKLQELSVHIFEGFPQNKAR